MIITAELKLFRKYFLIIVCCDSVKTPSMNNWPRTIAAQEILPRTIAPPGLLPSPQINAPEKFPPGQLPHMKSPQGNYSPEFYSLDNYP